MPLQARQCRAGFIGGADDAGLGLRDPCLRQFGLRPQPSRVPYDIALGVALVDQASSGFVTEAQRQFKQLGADPSRGTAGDPFEALQKPDPLGLMSGLNADRLYPGPIILKIFSEQARLLIVKVCEKESEEFAGAMLENRIMGYIERRDHGLEQMHLWILPTRPRRRQPFKKAAVRGAELRVHERKQRVNFGANLRVTIKRINSRERQQHERVVIGIAQGVQHGAVVRQGMDKSRPAFGTFRFGQKIIHSPESEFAALGIPAHLRSLRVAIDLSRLHKDAARRLTIGAAVLIQPVHEPAGRAIPSRVRPQGQAVFDDVTLEVRDDVRIEPVCCEGTICFRHCVPRSIANTV